MEPRAALGSYKRPIPPPRSAVRHSPFRALLPIVALAATLPVAAQSFDAATQAKGWAHQDRDFSFTFFDPTARTLVTWDKGFGVMNTLSLAKLEAEPEMWFMDRYNNAWIISGDMLYFVTKDGKVDRKDKLPALVADVAWEGQTGFAISYRTAQPFIEMRDMKDGSVNWSHGQKPKKGEAPARPLYQICMKAAPGQEAQVYVADTPAMTFTVLSGKKGQVMGQSVFSLDNQASPTLTLGSADPGPLCPWIGKDVIFRAVDSTTLPASASKGLNGLLLARLDISASTLSFEPTGLTPEYRFIGVVDGQAVFTKPGGGLAFVAVQ